MYKISYFKLNEGIKNMIIDFDNIIHKPQNVFLKDKMPECKFCKHKILCMKISIEKNDTEETEVAKQFLNEAIIDCCYYHNINTNTETNIISIKRMFSSYLSEEIKKRENALKGVELN